jgi:hypothetical protein
MIVVVVVVVVVVDKVLTFFFRVFGFLNKELVDFGIGILKNNKIEYNN